MSSLHLSGEPRVPIHMPLAGTRVIEVGHSVAGPFAGQILADLGADVIKIERPGTGDDARAWGPPFWNGVSATFQAINRNKRSIAIDLKSADGAAVMHGLVKEADVLVQNMRPGLLEKIGLGANAMTALNPRLIYCNLTAFGETGPSADRPGYDPLIQAASGIMAVTGEEGRPPVRVGPSIVDMGAGMWAVISIQAALYRRTFTGQGCTVSGSLFETALCWMTIPIANMIADGAEPIKVGSETPMLAPYKAFHSKDRYIIIAAGSDSLFSRLCAVVGHPEWAEDERFAANEQRVRNRTLLNSLLDDIIGSRPAAEWVELFGKANVPCAIVRSVGEVLDDPQIEALGIVDFATDTSMKMVGLPISFNGARPAIGKAAPALDNSQRPIAF